MSYFRGLLRDLGLEQHAPTPLRVDNSGAIELSRDRKSCNRSRHIDRRFFKVRELQAAGQVLVTYVESKLNSADVMTKHLPYDEFYHHVTTLMGHGGVMCGEPIERAGSGVTEGGVDGQGRAGGARPVKGVTWADGSKSRYGRVA